MGIFFDNLQTAYATAYSNGLKRKYTEPKIYHGGKDFDLSKRWYVYYSYQHPTKKDKNGNPVMQRQTPITLKVNQRFKTKKERLYHLGIIREVLSEALKNGDSPYEDGFNVPYMVEYSALTALDFAYTLREPNLSDSTAKDYKGRLARFKSYLEDMGLAATKIGNIDKKAVTHYLNQVQRATSVRNRNNTRAVLSSLFSVLEDNEIIPRNFVENIAIPKTKAKRNKTYSLEVVDGLFTFMEKNDPLMLLFIKFVSYNFLRPVEVCRLRAGDINLSQKLLNVKAKNKPVKTKRIPDIVMAELGQMDLANAGNYLFTPYGTGPWETDETNRRDYFSKRFAKVKKKYNSLLLEQGKTYQLSKDHTIYSFRHTFITKLYRELRKKYLQTETYDILMLITGHSTLDALKQYLRDIDAELAADYSEYLT